MGSAPDQTGFNSFNILKTKVVDFSIKKPVFKCPQEKLESWKKKYFCTLFLKKLFLPNLIKRSMQLNQKENESEGVGGLNMQRKGNKNIRKEKC